MLVTTGLGPVNKKVYPSGAARATACAPRMFSAPGIFSTITGWPSLCERRSATVRAIMSMPMPGPNGTTNLIGRVGHVSAGAVPLKSTRTNTRSERRAILISSSCLWAFKLTLFVPTRCLPKTKFDNNGGEGHRRLAPTRSPAGPAWLSTAGSSAACSAHWRSCAPSSVGRGSAATLPRSPARSRARQLSHLFESNNSHLLLGATELLLADPVRCTSFFDDDYWHRAVR